MLSYLRSLVDIAQSNPPNGRWNMFAYGPPILTTDTYPDDLDTTTVALLTLDIPEHVKHKTMDDMLNYMNSDGLLYVGEALRIVAYYMLSTDTDSAVLF